MTAEHDAFVAALVRADIEQALATDRLHLVTIVDTAYGEVRVSTIELSVVFSGGYETCLFGPERSEVVEHYLTESDAAQGHSDWCDRITVTTWEGPSCLES